MSPGGLGLGLGSGAFFEPALSIGCQTDQGNYGARRMRLLLVEDDAAMQAAMQRALERRGFQVSVCGDGARALDRWRAAVPDAVVLDLSLPGMDGLQVLAQARAEGLDAPVIILT